MIWIFEHKYVDELRTNVYDLEKFVKNKKRPLVYSKGSFYADLFFCIFLKIS